VEVGILKHLRAVFFVTLLGGLISCGRNEPLPLAEDCIVRIEIDWLNTPTSMISSKLIHVHEQVVKQLYMIVKPVGATAIHGDRSEFIYFQLPEMCEQKFDILGAAVTKSNVNNSGGYYVRVSDLLFKPGIETIIASGPPWRQD
jgi:hypothetical protein